MYGSGGDFSQTAGETGTSQRQDGLLCSNTWPTDHRASTFLLVWFLFCLTQKINWPEGKGLNKGPELARDSGSRHHIMCNSGNNNPKSRFIPVEM